MFLTQTEFEARCQARTLSRSKSLMKKKFQKLSSMNSDHQAVVSKKSSSTRTFNINDLNKEFVFVRETKWNKIVDLFNMPPPARGIQDEQEEVKAIRPGLAFYKLMANEDLLKKYKLRANFPETYIQLSGQLIEIKTNSNNYVQARKVKVDSYSALMLAQLQNQIIKIQDTGIKYKKHYDYRQNSFAPVVITKVAQESDTKFEVNVQNYKNFGERRSRPSNNKIVQRYVYSRGMRAMVMRIVYNRKKLGEQREQFYGHRFQNVDNIFKANKKNNEIYETFKAQATITATYERQDKIQYSKITNIKGLQKFIQPSKELIKFLESSQKIRVNEIYIDFLVDLFDKPWLINIKAINYDSLDPLKESLRGGQRVNDHKYSLHIVGSYGICRLCSIEYLKKNLKKTISNKMLCWFLSHLRKRMRVDQYESLQFVKDIIRKNIKNYITLQVCQSCYQIVAEQYKLIKSEQKLACMCSINSHIQANQHRHKPMHLPNTMKQWRLMLFFVGISSLPLSLLKDQNQIFLRYRLGNGDAVENNWKIQAGYKTNSSNFYGNYSAELNINKIKIHYFYSEALDIAEFLKQTQITLQLATAQDQKIFAKGSSGSLSCFGTQFSPDLCLRQTSTVLLFYNNGQYCEMTFKIGLMCDGQYQVPDSASLVGLNRVYFADNNFTNSNPIPKEWMQAFGVSQETKQHEIMMKSQFDSTPLLYDDPQRAKNVNRKPLVRKSMHLYR